MNSSFDPAYQNHHGLVLTNGDRSILYHVQTYRKAGPIEKIGPGNPVFKVNFYKICFKLGLLSDGLGSLSDAFCVVKIRDQPFLGF